MNIYNGEIIVRCSKPPVFTMGGVNVYVGRNRDGGEIAEIAEDIIFKKHDMAITSNPLFSLSPTQSQALMDNLWDCGLRPSEGSGSAGAMKATQNHLEDMRKLAGVKS